jgi:type VI secretion system secreted protein VgrG
MTRVVFKTATVPGDGTTNEIYFEDAAEAEEMFIHASRDMTYRIRDLRSEIVGADSRRKVGNVHTLNVGQSLGERVIGDQAISIGTDEKLEVVGDRSKTVTQNEDETVGGSRTLKVGKTQSLAVSGNRQLTVGPAMIDLTLGSVAMNSRDAITLVGGAVCKLAGGDISESAGLASIQAVGGAKVEIAKQDRPLDVRKAYRQVVGGAIVLKTHGRYSDNADTTASWLVGGALDAEAPQLHVEAEKTLRIKCGNSVLTLTTDSIHLGADNVDLSGAHLDANTGTIEHN